MKNSDLLLSIIIISYNTQDLTLQTLDSIVKEIKNSKLLKNKTEIIAIDNHSTDKSPEFIKKFLRNSKCKYLFIANKKNLGFAKANNQGIKQSKAKFILLLNSDTIVQKSALENLIETFQKYPIRDKTAALISHQGVLDKLGILSATLLNSDSSIQKHGGSTPTLFSLFNHMLMLDKLPLIGRYLPSTQYSGRSKKGQVQELEKIRPIQQGWVCAAAVLVKKEVFNDIGLLDENFFMYGEDIEFCLRAKKHHWDIAIDPTSLISHLGSASSSSANALKGEFTAYQYIWAKHKADWQMPFLKSLLIIGAVLRIIIFDKIVKNRKKLQIYKEIIKKIS
ncbi:MAG: glycosyltransferase family 2 protein [Candidatus Woesebacteria bacterium]|jgi:GT2 family glycosyltransferase